MKMETSLGKVNNEGSSASKAGMSAKRWFYHLCGSLVLFPFCSHISMVQATRVIQTSS